MTTQAQQSARASHHHDYQREPRDSHVACHRRERGWNGNAFGYLHRRRDSRYAYTDDRLGRRRAVTFASIRWYVQLHASYIDDNPTNTSSDIYTIGVVFTDDDTGTAVGSATTTLPREPRDSHVECHLGERRMNGNAFGYLHRRSTQDTHTLTIDWGEGAPVTLPVSVYIQLHASVPRRQSNQHIQRYLYDWRCVDG